MLPVAWVLGVVIVVGVEVPTWAGEGHEVVVPVSEDAPVLVDNEATEGNEAAVDMASPEGKVGVGDWGAGTGGNGRSGAMISGGDFRVPPLLDFLAFVFFLAMLDSEG